MITRGQIAAMFRELSSGVDRYDGSLATSPLPHQQLRVVVRHRDTRERKSGGRDYAAEYARRTHAPGRGKAQYAVLKADPTKLRAVREANNAYRVAARVRPHNKGRGWNTAKLGAEAIADIKSSELSVMALARKHGVSRGAVRYQRSLR